MTNTISYTLAILVVSLLVLGLGVTSVHADHSHEEMSASHSVTSGEMKLSTKADTNVGTETRVRLQAMLDTAKAQLEKLLEQLHGNAHDDALHDAAEHSDGHEHDRLLEVDSDNVPTLEIKVHEDPMSGWNVELTVTNFTFAPQNASTEHVDGEGHAHIYVDGVKVNRVYGNWYHLSSLDEAGEHTISVELNSNNHSTLAHNGEKITDSVIVTTK